MTRKEIVPMFVDQQPVDSILSTTSKPTYSLGDSDEEVQYTDFSAGNRGLENVGPGSTRNGPKRDTETGIETSPIEDYLNRKPAPAFIHPATSTSSLLDQRTVMAPRDSEELDALTQDLQNKFVPNDPKSKKGSGKAGQNHGLVTPEDTPDVDNERVEADKARRKKPSNPSDTDPIETQMKMALEVVLACKHGENKEVLGLEPGRNFDSKNMEDMSTIERATFDRGVLVHPKFNSDKDAKRAWTRVKTAATILNCDKTVFKDVEEYEGHQDESGSNDSESDGDRMEGVESVISPPSMVIKRIYDEATATMTELMKNPKSRSTIKKLEKFNADIEAINREEEQSDVNMWFIKFDLLQEQYNKIAPALKLKDPNKARDELDSIANNVKYIVQHHHYPESWMIDSDTIMNKRAKGTKSKVVEKPTSSSRTSPYNKNGILVTGKIRAISPRVTKDIFDNDCILECYFAVETNDRNNPMEFVDSRKISTKLLKSYFENTLEEERIDLRGSPRKYSRADQRTFEKIIAVGAVPAKKESGVYPFSCIWVRHSDGNRFYSRSSFRQVFVPDEADRRIEEFFQEKKLRIPWSKRAPQIDVQSSRVYESDSSSTDSTDEESEVEESIVEPRKRTKRSLYPKRDTLRKGEKPKHNKRNETNRGSSTVDESEESGDLDDTVAKLQMIRNKLKSQKHKGKGKI